MKKQSNKDKLYVKPIGLIKDGDDYIVVIEAWLNYRVNGKVKSERMIKKYYVPVCKNSRIVIEGLSIETKLI